MDVATGQTAPTAMSVSGPRCRHNMAQLCPRIDMNTKSLGGSLCQSRGFGISMAEAVVESCSPEGLSKQNVLESLAMAHTMEIAYS